MMLRPVSHLLHTRDFRFIPPLRASYLLQPLKSLGTISIPFAGWPTPARSFSLFDQLWLSESLPLHLQPDQALARPVAPSAGARAATSATGTGTVERTSYRPEATSAAPLIDTAHGPATCLFSVVFLRPVFFSTWQIAHCPNQPPGKASGR